MMELLAYDFMQRAIIATVCIAIIAPILGLLLILKRQSLLADTLSHVSLAGVALGLLVQLSPTVTTVIVVVIAAMVIEHLRTIYNSYSEISIAILMSTGLAIALILMSFTNTKNGLKMDSYLFGSLVTVSNEQVSILIVLAISIAVIYIIFRRVLYVVLFTIVFFFVNNNVHFFKLYRFLSICHIKKPFLNEMASCFVIYWMLYSIHFY